MDTTILQVPVEKELRERAGNAAKAMGFSSLQESVRLFLNKLANGTLSIGFEEKSVQLSAKASKRLDKLTDRIETGKEPVYTASSVDELMDQLHDKNHTV